MAFCPNCGSNCKEGARFCTNCGIRLEFEEVSRMSDGAVPACYSGSTDTAMKSPRDDPFRRYLDTLEKRLNIHMEYSAGFNTYHFRTESTMLWARTIQSYFILHDDNAQPQQLFDLMVRCSDLIVNAPHKYSELQTIILLCQNKITPVIRQAMVQPPVKLVQNSQHLPGTAKSSPYMYYIAVMELSTGTLLFPEKTPAIGAEWKTIKKQLAENFYFYV